MSLDILSVNLNQKQLVKISVLALTATTAARKASHGRTRPTSTYLDQQFAVESVAFDADVRDFLLDNNEYI